MGWFLKAWSQVQWRLGFKIASLNSAFWVLKQEHYAKMMAAKKSADPARETARVRDAYRDVIAFHLERINFHNSQTLIEKALLFQLAVPDRPERGGVNEFWMQGSYGPILTDIGVEVLRPKVREEEKQRREGRLAWIPWIGAITGLAGTLIGLVAAFKN